MATPTLDIWGHRLEEASLGGGDIENQSLPAALRHPHFRLFFEKANYKFNFNKFPTLIMEKSGSPPSKKDSEYKDNEGSGDSNEWSDISSRSDEGGNEGKLEKKNSTFYSSQ